MTDPRDEARTIVSDARALVASDIKLLPVVIDACTTVVLAAGSASPEARRAALLGAQSAAALFSAPSEGSVHVRLGGAPFEVGAFDLTAERTTSRWLDGFFLACLARDQRSLRELVQFPADEFPEGTRPHRRSFVEAIVKWGHGDSTFTRTLERARAQVAALDEPSRAQAQALDAPLFDIQERLEQGDADSLARAISDAQQRHAVWYASPGLNQHLAAALPLGVLAFACIARAKGLGSPPDLAASGWLESAWDQPNATVVGAFPTDPRLLTIAADVLPLLTRLASAEAPKLVLELVPRDADFERVFVAEVAIRMRARYAAFWASPPNLRIDRTKSTIDVYVALSQAFLTGDVTTRHFPGGYADLAPSLQPELPWVAWRYRTPTESLGLLFDGLVRIDERWVWFPKPWRTG